MIKRHNRYYPGLADAWLPIVMEREGGVTLRMLTLRDETVKYPPVDENESRIAAILVKSPDANVRGAGKVILGQHLREDLEGKVFECVGEIGLSKDELGAGEWVDHATWVFYADGRGVPQMPVNRHVESYRTKASAPRMNKLRDQSSIMQVFVPFKSDSIAACCKSVCVGPLGMITNMAFDEEATIEDVVAGSGRKFLPSLAISAPESIRADRAAELTVTVTDSEGNPEPSAEAEVYLETTGGYISWQRVQTKDGVGKFKLRMTDLASGDEVRVKAGFRNFTGVTEVVVKVS